MEKIIFYLVIAGLFYLFSYISGKDISDKEIIGKIKKFINDLDKENTSERSAEIPTGEAFPKMQPLETDIAVPKSVKTSVKTKPDKPRLVFSEGIAEKSENKSTDEIKVEKRSEKRSEHGRLVSLSSKSEVKRAFIYSEIINRKY